jgi:hypothetical protein
MIRVVHQGLGPIGRGVAALVLEDPDLETVGALDINPAYRGKDLGDLLGTRRLGIEVRDDAEALLSEVRPDVVVLATCSFLEKIIPSLELAVRNGASVISPAEELFYPEFINRESAGMIDKLAIKHGVSVIGGAVNPGCLMDAFPLQVFRSNFDSLKSIHVRRWDDTAERRLPLLEKTGAGLSKEEFRALDRQGKLGHAGLRMSAAYLADGTGLMDYEIAFKRDPVIAARSVKLKEGKTIEPGQVAGLHETCSIITQGRERITLDLRMYAGAENRNSVSIAGTRSGEESSKKVDCSNIVNGDVSTVRILKDAISHAVNGPPGLNRTGYVPDPHELLGKRCEERQNRYKLIKF